MKFLIKSLVSIILVISMLLSTAVLAFAEVEEVYLSELRIVYANSYDEAKNVLTNSKLEGYEILNENLNSGTGEVGVWLAYKTTTNIEDAITDISVMQMNGGYSEGNFQQMIKQSKEEYLAMGKIYLDAVDYFMEAYDSGNFLAKSAYRQLNVYSGLDNYPDERLGDLFVDGALTESDLATLFMEGNSYVLKNIRSLLAMGVSYNEEGLHYLQRVSLLASGTYSGYVIDSVKGVTADDIDVVDDVDLDEISALIAPSIITFRNMFAELLAYENELDYSDDVITDLELKYVEYKAMADMMSAVDYLNGQSLYEFCMDYVIDNKDYSSLYPLAMALNEGQIAMTKVMHYYDVVRYSMNETPESQINAQLKELEAKFADNPFDVYTGVDRDMYKGTFALTSAAYRADAYTDSVSLMDALFGNGAWIATSGQIAAGAVGAGLFAWAIKRSLTKSGSSAAATTIDEASDFVDDLSESFMSSVESKATGVLGTGTLENGESYMHALERIAEAWSEYRSGALRISDFYNYTPELKMECLMDVVRINDGIGTTFNNEQSANIELFKKISDEYYKAGNNVVKSAQQDAEVATQAAVKTSGWGTRLFTGAIYIVGALSMAYSAVSIYTKIHDYYNPKYDVVPEAMVDLVDTVDGDRYIKYDVVYEATVRDTKTGKYHPGDLNAYKGQRWNAIYYTKSYEAGKPLLAEFVISKVNNRAEEGYLPVHRFGEVVCYDLNKYTFKSASDTLYLSVAQSENQKSAVADVPDVVGSVFGSGFVFLACGAGLVVGVGGTFCVQSVIKKKKASE